MAIGDVAPATLTAAQLAARGPYVDVQFIWNDLLTANLFYRKPYRDADGTLMYFPTIYINLATLFETTAAGGEESGPATAVGIAQESHNNTFGAAANLTEAQAEALKMHKVIWVDADPTGGTNMIGTLVGSPGTWVIVFPTFIDVATGLFGGHVGAMTNMGAITAAQLAGVRRLTVNFINFGVGGGAQSSLYTIAGSRDTYVINLAETMDDNEIDAACH